MVSSQAAGERDSESDREAERSAERDLVGVTLVPADMSHLAFLFLHSVEFVSFM